MLVYQNGNLDVEVLRFKINFKNFYKSHNYSSFLGSFHCSTAMAEKFPLLVKHHGRVHGKIHTKQPQHAGMHAPALPETPRPSHKALAQGK